MTRFIRNIAIRNFKSIHGCEINRCNRINLFIGRPNVGKSNILEALSLFSVPYLRENTAKKLSSLIRLENESELFYRGDDSNEVAIITDIGSCSLNYTAKSGLNISINIGSELYSAKVDSKLNVTKAINTGQDFTPRIKRYSYKSDVVYKSGHAKYLIPPYGLNLLSIIQNYEELKIEVENFFKEYGLEIAFDKSSQTIKIIQRDRGSIFLIPYTSIADTLQRIIFYKAAIASNDDSVLLFEEPEAHAFPPYMTQFTQDIIYKKDCQYFIATHSPFVLNDFLENAQEEVAVFIVFYEKGETRLRRLTQDELHDAYQSGVDFFTNSESFIG